jgi:diguanylate cyclase (GGDEF)-like protein
VLFDLDHFKDINDNYGHPTGDIALKHVAKNISSQLGERDSIGRIGSEEFMALLTDVPEEQVWVKVEKMQDLIESKTFMSEDHQTLNLTASFSYLSTSEKLIDFDVLYSILDQALYQAKLNGRNCIVDAYTDPIDAIRHSASTATTA